MVAAAMQLRDRGTSTRLDRRIPVLFTRRSLFIGFRSSASTDTRCATLPSTETRIPTLWTETRWQEPSVVSLGLRSAFRGPGPLAPGAWRHRGTRNEAPRMWWSTWSGAGGWDKWAMALRGWRCE
eukprot:tig00020572_g11582.t1